ncbi:unnamed protein product [Lymnaea stagnalis]|uniref:Nucleolar protein 12 n=1 Tax=Lymnaea stagnalis TaxID=6523 RepID=A0AAV2HXG3_LYMST
MAASIIKKKQKPKNRKTKIILEFDEKARVDYLKGFHKRKIDRKKLAREQQDKKILEERKELLKQARDLKNNQMRQQSVVIPEIEHLVNPEVYDLPEHTVTIANIGDVDFVGKAGLRLGQNTGSDKDSDDDTPATANPVQNKSLRQKLATCSNQLSSTKLKAKKMKKKHMLRQKFQTKRKGEKKGKKKKYK